MRNARQQTSMSQPARSSVQYGSCEPTLRLKSLTRLVGFVGRGSTPFSLRLRFSPPSALARTRNSTARQCASAACIPSPSPAGTQIQEWPHLAACRPWIHQPLARCVRAQPCSTPPLIEAISPGLPRHANSPSSFAQSAARTWCRQPAASARISARIFHLHCRNLPKICRRRRRNFGFGCRASTQV